MAETTTIFDQLDLKDSDPRFDTAMSVIYGMFNTYYPGFPEVKVLKHHFNHNNVLVMDLSVPEIIRHMPSYQTRLQAMMSDLIKCGIITDINVIDEKSPIACKKPRIQILYKDFSNIDDILLSHKVPDRLNDLTTAAKSAVAKCNLDGSDCFFFKEAHSTYLSWTGQIPSAKNKELIKKLMVLCKIYVHVSPAFYNMMVKLLCKENRQLYTLNNPKSVQIGSNSELTSVITKQLS